MELRQKVWYWHELIKTVNEYNRIYVTGPQRSGTRYGSFAIAKDLWKYKVIYSGKIDVDLRDFENAITKDTGLIMVAHTSNYKVIGFTECVEIKELVKIGKKDKCYRITLFCKERLVNYYSRQGFKVNSVNMKKYL